MCSCDCVCYHTWSTAQCLIYVLYFAFPGLVEVSSAVLCARKIMLIVAKHFLECSTQCTLDAAIAQMLNDKDWFLQF